MLYRVQSFVLIGIDPLLCGVGVNVSKSGPAKSVIIGPALMAV